MSIYISLQLSGLSGIGMYNTADNKSQHHGKMPCPARHLLVCLPICKVALRLNVVGPGTVRARPFRVKATWTTLEDSGYRHSVDVVQTEYTFYLLGPRIPGSSVDCPWARRYM